MTKTVKSIQKIETKPVFDITVDGDHHYILGNGLVSHNSGLKYAASTIVYLSKKKEKVDNEVVGNIIHCKLYKGRLTRENKMIDTLLTFDKGLDKHYGLVPLAIKHGVFKKNSTKIELPDGKTVFESQINKNPEKYYTEEILKAIDAAASKEFKYGMEEAEIPNGEEAAAD
jgi:hypothetical protein